MTKVLQNYFPRNISQYVPLMEFAADVVDGKILVNLGSPSTKDQDGILNGKTIGDGAAHTFTSADWETTFDGSSTHVGESVAGTLNAKYGRCLVALGDASTDELVTITGRDYLGQIISEDLTLAGIVLKYGNKAFKYVDTVLVSSSSGGTTIDLGWTDRLGLPYKSEKILTYTEDDVSMPVDPVDVAVEVDGVRHAAGTDVVVPSPVAGQITGANSVLTTAQASADSVNTVVVGSTDVAGLSITIADPSAVGVADSDIVTTDDDQVTSTVAKYGAIGISADGGGTGSAMWLITVEPLTYVAADETATVTTTTNDTRGTILCTTACDASIEYEVSYTCDATNLHGVPATTA